MIIRLLHIRLLQLYREFRVIGFIRTFFVIFLVLPFVVAFLYQRAGMEPYCYILPACIAVGVLWVQCGRRDLYFLKHIVKYPWLVCFAEYVLFTSFWLVILLLKGQYVIAGLYLLALAGVAGLPAFRSSLPVYSFWVRFIPDGLYEWKSGFRQNMGGIVLAVLLGIAGIFSFVFSMIALFLFVLVFTAFYIENEPLSLLIAGQCEHFLRHKLWFSVRCFALLLVPFLGIALLHTAYVGYAVTAYVAALNLLAFAILLKYSYYRPGTYVMVRQLLLALVCLISVILPLGLFVLLVNFMLYRKALKNIKNCLYACD